MRRWTLAGVVGLLWLVVAATPAFAVGPAVGVDGEPATLIGTLEVIHGDDFTHGRPDFIYQLQTSTGRVQLDFPSAGPRNAGGARVRVAGRRLGDRLTVSASTDGAPRMEILAPAPKSATSVGTLATAEAPIAKTIAVVLVNFSNDTSQPFTAASAAGVVFSNSNSVAAFFEEESRGRVTVSGQVFGWYTIAASNANCDWSTWQSQAQSAASAAGVNLSGYSHVVFAWPYATSCGWAGLGYMPGRYSYINGSFSLPVIAHELSHNFGVNHASTLSCTSGGVRVSLGGSCTYSEYGDPFTVMGMASWGHNHAQQVGGFGWLASSEVQTVTPGGTYTVGSLLGTAAGTVKSLRVARGDGTWFYLDVRSTVGPSFDNFSASDPAVTGVTIRLSPDAAAPTYSPNNSKLVDATPATATFSDAPLAVAQTLLDPVSGISFTTQSVGAAGASISITEAVPPSAPGSLVATSSGSTAVDLAWAAATDNVGVAGYRVYRDGNLITTVAGSARTYHDAGLAPETGYSYSLVAVDGSGNAGPAATASVTTSSPDAAPPSPVSGLSATALSATSIRLAWTAATDDVGIAGYRITRGGVLVATTALTTWTDAGRSPLTAYQYTVVAVDGAGNVSDPVAASATTLADKTKPTKPGSPHKRVSTTTVRLSWTASTDNVKVVEYRIYRVGYSGPVARTKSLYVYLRLRHGATYYIRAVDAAGNRSDRTAYIKVY